MSIGTESDLILIAGGLEPGQKLEASFAYNSDDKSEAFNTGASQQTVRSNGVVRFTVDYDEVTGGTMKPGDVACWVHLPGPFNSPPVETADGPASITVRVPPAA